MKQQMVQCRAIELGTQDPQICSRVLLTHVIWVLAVCVSSISFGFLVTANGGHHLRVILGHEDSLAQRGLNKQDSTNKSNKQSNNQTNKQTNKQAYHRKIEF